MPYDHPDAVMLVAELQQEYIRRYGGTDRTPVDPGEFAPPRGVFLVGYLGDALAACGGWRTVDGRDSDLLAGDVEIKRMYVVPVARGNGLARRLLAALEHTAARAGHRRMVLETGTAQPEALGLYRSAGYTEIPSFGIHRHSPRNRCFARLLVRPGGSEYLNQSHSVDI